MSGVQIYKYSGPEDPVHPDQQQTAHYYLKTNDKHHDRESMKTTCMTCKYYKIEDALSGYCRFTSPKEAGKSRKDRPMVRQDHSCQEWRDCGQQYYIRLGWLKSRKDKGADPT